MIKLNNKNITYVALADSANSLKAPKEIWYADSNNSVKLVYRRKDELIEGIDYEKYHWILTDTGNPYIQVDDICNTDENAYIETTYKSKYTNPGADMLIGFSITESNNIGIRIFSFDYCTYVDYHKMVNGVLSSRRVEQLQSNINAERYIKATFNNLIIDTTEYPSINWGSGFDNIKNPVSPVNPVTELYTNRHSNDVRYKRTKLRVNFKEYDLIPCKLLKPVPKWLDANGIRRQVGECGMIDLVSGKFYGNVNSVGTFTVENYYERKEWLVGDGSAYIKGIDYNLWVNRVELKVGKINVTTIQNNELHYKPTDGDGNVWAVQQNPTITPQFICIFRESGAFAHIVHIDLMPSQVTLSFYQNGGYAYCLYNDTENKGGTLNQSSWDTNIIPTIFSYKMSYIREVLPNGSYRSNLIPCTLTMDLPASMDANEIARTKGTSGMWDLVSDRFYGNVANSGTFKAVNLAEGVDYEEYKWLVAEIPPQSVLMTIEIGDVFNYSRVYESIGNSSHLLTNGYNYYSSSPVMTSIGVWNGSQNVENKAVNFTNGLNVVCTQDKLTFNSVEFPKYGFPAKLRWNNSANTGGADTVVTTSSITVDGSVRYVPCKLLRDIPAELDANGIARQAGECGMYDTVNDKFYGNMASSGTFSVSDDS